MKVSWIGRITAVTLASLALGLGMTACGGGTIAYMWVIGDQYSQLTGYKVDDYTGNLTQSPGSPFSTQGTNPVSILVKPGGRYLYVVNAGSAPSTGAGTNFNVSSGVSVFAVGGDGTLTFQQTYTTQGYNPVWAQFDSTGTYLYVLDKYQAVTTPGAGATPSTNGVITAFQTDGSTGRLTLITNSTTKVNGTNISYFPVGASPIMLKSLAGCLFTLDSDRTLYSYSFGGGGQLTTTAVNGVSGQPISGSVNLTSINGGGSTMYITDAGANKILPYSIGGGCALAVTGGGPTSNLTGTTNPVYSIVDNANKYLYVLNATAVGNGTGIGPYSSISAFTINQSNGQLQQIAGSPYGVGANPVCMVEDPTNQYIYVSNRNDGTVTGKVIDSTTGELSPLTRGSTFPASGLGGCLAISGAVN